MTVHLERGRRGEELGAAYLEQNGFVILFRNWRYSYYEIDLVAVKHELLHFVEVKMRSSNKYGFPEDNVSRKKIRYLLNAADQFLHLHPQYKNFQLDVLSITARLNSPPEYFLIEDVYER